MYRKARKIAFWIKNVYKYWKYCWQIQQIQRIQEDQTLGSDNLKRPALAKFIARPHSAFEYVFALILFFLKSSRRR